MVDTNANGSYETRETRRSVQALNEGEMVDEAKAVVIGDRHAYCEGSVESFDEFGVYQLVDEEEGSREDVAAPPFTIEENHRWGSFKVVQDEGTEGWYDAILDVVFVDHASDLTWEGNER